ncbi:MAG TPA: hypothetical protein VMI54_23835 [Polyangiaceae bacterium]|nr:hypothetical protein [Polyangiaceae bacterium]
MRADTVTRFLLEAVRTVRSEQPDIHHALCRKLHGRAVRLTIGVESLVLGVPYVELEACELAPQVELACTRATLVALLDARVTLLEALLSDQLLLKGAPLELVRFHDALLLFLAGAARSPSMPALLSCFLSPPAEGAAARPRVRGNLASIGARVERNQ